MNYFYVLLILHTACTWTMHNQHPGWTVIKEISFHGPTSCVHDKDNKFVIGLTNHTFITQHYFASKPLTVFFEYKSPVSHITLSPAQKYLYGVSTKDPHCTKRLYTLWSIATKRILHQLERPNLYYHLSPNDTYLITQEKGTIEIRDPQTGNILRTIAPIHDDITKLDDPYFVPSFNNNEIFMAIAHKPPTSQAIYNADKSRIINLLTKHVTDIYGSQCTPAFSSDSRYLATATESGAVNIYSAKELKLFVILKYAAHSLTFTSHNKLIIKNQHATNPEYLALMAENDPQGNDVYYAYKPSLIIVNPVSLERVKKYDNTICSSDAKRLCIFRHLHQHDAQGPYHTFLFTLLDSYSLKKSPAYCDITKIYPAPLYMSPHGRYIVIPSYEYDLVLDACQTSYMWHQSGRYGNIHFSDDENTVVYQPDQKTVVLLKR